jgi:hypothetical protein
MLASKTPNVKRNLCDDLRRIGVIDGDAEDFVGAHDEFYDVEAHEGMLAEGFELGSNVPTHAMKPHEWGTRCTGPPAGIDVWATRHPIL